MEFSETPEFSKEFKKLERKYRTLTADIAVLKKSLTTNPRGDGSKHWHVRHEDKILGVTALKVRMMCRAVRGTQFRVTYIYQTTKIEILFIEVYYKGYKENEDFERLKNYFELKQKEVRDKD
jgi:hypothetical protein